MIMKNRRTNNWKETNSFLRKEKTENRRTFKAEAGKVAKFLFLNTRYSWLPANAYL